VVTLSSIVPKVDLRSRIHRLRSFEENCYVKREDELGFGVSGSKVRKYSSFLPSFLSEKPNEAIIPGSAYSNHVLSLSQLLKENGVKPILFLLGNPIPNVTENLDLRSHQSPGIGRSNLVPNRDGDSACYNPKLQGNFLLTALIAGLENIHWISRKKWGEIDDLVVEYANKRAAEGLRAIAVPKGANCASSLPGVLTLALDILRNEKEHGIEFDHLFIDSGTGITASALLLAFALLGKQTFVHILLIAGNKEEFKNTLEQRKKDLEVLLKKPIPSPLRFNLYIPSTAPSFGSVNAAVFNAVANLAREEGFLTDPVFTAKLFLEGKKVIKEQKLKGNILFVHSGGGLGLTGFQEEMSKRLYTT